MTVPAPRVRRRPSVAGRALPLLLVLALLAPLGLLFAQTDRHTGDDRDLAARERLGVRYLRALGPVTDALVEAQSDAVAGRPVSRAALASAVERAAEVDSAVGDELRSHDRWSGLRAKLEAVPDRGLTDPEAAYQAYGEVSDLLLALHRKVRESSGLIRDPRSDSFFLQDAVGGDLPEAMVAAGRLADLAALAARRPAADRAKSATELAGLRMTALAPATDLVADLRTAVESSESTDLGSTVLTPLDTYQRSVEALAAFSAPDPRSGGEPADPSRLTAARLTAHTAAKQLQPVILDQLDALLRARLRQLDRDRQLAQAAVGVAGVLLVLLAGTLLAALRRARRRVAAEPQRSGSAAPAAEPDPAGPGQSGTGQGGPGQSGPGQSGPGQSGPGQSGQLEQVGTGRAGEPERWRPFDAAR